MKNTKKSKKSPLLAYFGSYLDAVQGSPSAIQGLSNPDTTDLVTRPTPSMAGMQTLPLYNPSDIDVTKAVGPNNQITNIDQKSNIVPNQIREQAKIDKKQLFGNQNTPQIDVKSIAGSILPFINALTGERDPARTAPFAPPEVYNPHPLGTKSQALYNNGGTLSAEKAKEMIKNPPYNKKLNKKLTKKQNAYFHLVAEGKAQNGMELEQFGDPVPYATTFTSPEQNIYNKVNRLLVTGGNPMSSAEGKALLQSKESGNQKKTRALIDNIGIYNQRPEVINMSPEQRVENYYQMVSDNPDVRDFKQSYKNYGSGPTASLWNSPERGQRASKSLAKQENGGVISYNPNLAEKDRNFQKWYSANTLEGQKNIPFSDKLDYDYYSFYRNKGEGNIENHFPDTYKRPIHQTFSNESIYSTPENTGGSWKGDVFIPSKGKKKAFWGAIAGVAGQAGGQIKDLLKKQTAAAAEAPGQIMQSLAQIANFKDTFHPTQGYQPGPYIQPDQMMYDNGGQVNGDTQVMLHDKGNTEMLSYNPYDGGTMQLNGPSHEQGGIDMSYGGNRIEAEGQETAVKDAEGNLHIMGNMKVPGSNTKFKQISKKIAKQEEKYDQLKTEGSALVKINDPQDKWQRFKFNAGTIMAQGGDIGQKDLAKKKNELSSLQNALLATAEEYNISPDHLSSGEIRKAKKGTFKKAAYGMELLGDPVPKKSVAVRNNNPGNIKYGEFAKRHGAVKGDPSTDGGNFAVFPDVESGMQALQSLLKTKNYKNLPVEDAIKRWTNGTGYSIPLGDLKGKKVGDLNFHESNQLINTITGGEDGKYYNIPKTVSPSGNPSVTPLYRDPNQSTTPFSLPNIPFTYKNPIAPTPEKYTPPQQDVIQPIPDRNIPSNVKGLSLGQILPELYAAGNNKLEPVNSQHYTPLLEQPYQVSFQDRLNAHQSTFNALTRQIGTSSPTALSSLSADKYNADSSVLADEFRTNQGEANRVYNANRNTLNDAQLKNLAIDDQQYTRQQQAKSNTKAQSQEILNSIASKYKQNRLNNQRLAIGENFYNFRQSDTNKDGIPDKLTTYNPDVQFEYSGMQKDNVNDYQRTMQKYDGNNTLKQTIINTPSATDRRLSDLKVQKLDDKPKFNITKLFKGLFN